MKQVKKNHLVWFGFVFAFVCLFNANAELHSEETKSELQTSNEEVDWRIKDKRPFCNAFAGCGRKRAQLAKELENIALGRAVPSYAYYTNSDMKLLHKLLNQIQRQNGDAQQDDIPNNQL